MIDLLSMMPEELEYLMKAWDEPLYRAGQIFSYLPKAPPSSDEFLNLPKNLRERLAFIPPELIKRQISKDGNGTEKLLYKMGDGQTVESVVLRYHAGISICISSQAGCRQGCVFCASAIGGRVRNLTAGEMLGQVFYSGHNISKLVLMGIGEPLDNYDNVVKFLRLISHPKGRNLGLRHVSLSTCGLADAILKLAEEKLPVTLSVSLHAGDDATRSMLMPVNREYNLTSLLYSTKIYYEKTGRRNSFEYALIKGINDSREDAKRLAQLLRRQNAHVNLIPLNPVEGKHYRPSDPETVKIFALILKEAGLQVTVRRRLGMDIDAACGQLRRKNANTEGRMTP